MPVLELPESSGDFVGEALVEVSDFNVEGSLYPIGASKSTLQSVSMIHAASFGLTSLSSKW